MSTQAEVIDRIKFYLQDEIVDTAQPAWLRLQVQKTIQHELLRLSRAGVFRQAFWCQAIDGREEYPLNQLGIRVASGTDTAGSSTLLAMTDSTASFVSAGVTTGMRLRNLTDGSAGIITTVAATVLTCSAGLSGGTANAWNSGDIYLVESLVEEGTVTAIDFVLYDGTRLDGASERLRDVTVRQWERKQIGPRYFTVDNLETPSILRITPPPLTNGSSTLSFLPGPFLLPWEGNFLVFAQMRPALGTDENGTTAMLPHWEDLMIWRSIEHLAGVEGDYQDRPLAQAARQMAQLLGGPLGVARG